MRSSKGRLEEPRTWYSFGRGHGRVRLAGSYQGQGRRWSLPMGDVVGRDRALTVDELTGLLDIESNNRWRKQERAKNREASLSMLDTYTDVVAALEMHLVYSRAL